MDNIYKDVKCFVANPRTTGPKHIMEQLWSMVQALLDPLQFAHQPRLRVENAIIYMLTGVTRHLQKYSDDSA